MILIFLRHYRKSVNIRNVKGKRSILAAWFIAETKLDWDVQFARDPDLLAHYEVEVLPALSVANLRALLRATLPLPQLSPNQAIDLVVKHLVNRVRSRKSRLKNRASP